MWHLGPPSRRACAFATVAALALPGSKARAQSATPPDGTTEGTAAADDDLSSDRPGFTDGPLLVRRGRQQLEAGYAYTRAGREREHTVGETLLRIGFRPSAELRVALNSYVVASGAPTGRASGLEDAQLGAKLRLVSGDDAVSLRPRVSLIAMTSVPTGGLAFGRRASEPSGVLTAQWQAPRATALVVNVGAAARDADGGRRAGEYSAGASFDAPITRTLTSFVEYFTRSVVGDDPTQAFATGGVTLAVGHGLQLDASASAGLRRGTPDARLNAGVVRRW
jgi:hypothetical protein